MHHAGEITSPIRRWPTRRATPACGGGAVRGHEPPGDFGAELGGLLIAPILVFSSRDIYYPLYPTFEMHLRQDLAASGLFASVDYQEWPDLADSYQNYDLIITGRYYVHTRQTDVFPLMGLLLLQPLLGLPTGAIDRNMAFEVQVLDPQPGTTAVGRAPQSPRRRLGDQGPLLRARSAGDAEAAK